jgi:hypothetical protein
MVVGDKKFGVRIFPPLAGLGLHFVHFLKNIFGYTVLHLTLIYCRLTDK